MVSKPGVFWIFTRTPTAQLSAVLALLLKMCFRPLLASSQAGEASLKLLHTWSWTALSAARYRRLTRIFSAAALVSSIFQSRSIQDTDREKVMVRVALFPALSVTFTFMVCSPFRPANWTSDRAKVYCWPRTASSMVRTSWPSSISTTSRVSPVSTSPTV